MIRFKKCIPITFLLSGTLTLLTFPMVNSQAVTLDELKANPARYTKSYDSLFFSGRYDFYPKRTYSEFLPGHGYMSFDYAETYWDSLKTKLFLSAAPYYFVTTERHVLWEDKHLMRIRLIEGFSSEEPNNGWFVAGDIHSFTRSGEDRGSLLPASVPNDRKEISRPYWLTYNSPLFYSVVVNQSPYLLESQINELTGYPVFATPTVTNDPLWKEHEAFIATKQSKLKTPPDIPLTVQKLPENTTFLQESSEFPWPTTDELQRDPSYAKIGETIVPELNGAMVSTYLDTKSLKLLWQNDEDMTVLGTLYDIRKDTEKLIRTHVIFSFYKTPKAPVADTIYMIHLLSATHINGVYTVGGANCFRQMILPNDSFYETLRPLLYQLKNKAEPVTVSEKDQNMFQQALQKGIDNSVRYGEENIARAEKERELSMMEVKNSSNQFPSLKYEDLQRREQFLQEVKQQQEDLKNYQAGKVSLAGLRQKALVLSNLW